MFYMDFLVFWFLNRKFIAGVRVLSPFVGVFAIAKEEMRERSMTLLGGIILFLIIKNFSQISTNAPHFINH